MAPKRPDTMADTVIAKCVQNKQLNALFRFLVLFGAHILSFYEWKVVIMWQFRCDSLCVYWQINIKLLREKITINVFGSEAALIRWGGKYSIFWLDTFSVIFLPILQKSENAVASYS